MLTGWPSFVHGEATAGDVLAMEAVSRALEEAGAECHAVWSPVMRPDGLTLERADPADYTHLVFACGPLHGEQIEALHHRYSHCRRIAVGVSVVDPDEPAVTGFDVVLPRDAPGEEARLDLSVAAPPSPHLPAVGVVLSPGQKEYGPKRLHKQIETELTDWLGSRRCARVPLDTRLDPRDWRHAATPSELEAAVQRLDLVVTTRLHGLVLALRNGVPALAVDPVAGGAKVAAQARAWGWPAVIVTPEQATPPFLHHATLDRWWTWCRSGADGRPAADFSSSSLLTDLLKIL